MVFGDRWRWNTGRLSLRGTLLVANMLSLVIMLALLIQTGDAVNIIHAAERQIATLATVKNVELKAMVTPTPACLITFQARPKRVPLKEAITSGKRYWDVWLITTSQEEPHSPQKIYRCLLSLPILSGP